MDEAKGDFLLRQKLANVRASVSHLTKQLHTLTDKLAKSHQQLDDLARARARETELLVEERDGARALASVWEARFRDELSQREALQTRLAASTSAHPLNDRHARAATKLILAHKISPTRARSSSSASSSSSTEEETDRRTPRREYSGSTSDDWTVSTAVPQRERPPRMRTRQLVADLSRELERVRREADRLLADRDEEIARLEADAAFRRKESATFYASVDKLLSLGTSVASSHHWSQPNQIPFQPHSRSSSILDRSDFQRAASQSCAPHAAALEAEVRQLELELQSMAALGLKISDKRSNGALLDESGGPDQTAALGRTIEGLNAQVAELRRDLAAVTNERATLRSLYDRTRREGDQPLGSESETESAARRVAQVEADKARLVALLHASEGESLALSHQLAQTQAQVELISERVKSKLLEQKANLSQARQRIAALEAELASARRALEERTRSGRGI